MAVTSVSRRIFRRCIIGLVLLVSLTHFVLYRQSARAVQGLGLRCRPPTAEQIATWEAEEAEYRRVVNGGEFHKPLELFVEYAGHQQVTLKNAAEADCPNETPIVGVEVDNLQCAFILDEMKDPARHVVNLVMNGTPISVAYCDLVDCVRVVTDDSQTPIPLNVGGLDIDKQLVLLLGGKRYGQESADLPLADHPFIRTTLGDWKKRFPQTMICIPSEVE
jgi:hypothetical protein